MSVAEWLPQDCAGPTAVLFAGAGKVEGTQDIADAPTGDHSPVTGVSEFAMSATAAVAPAVLEKADNVVDDLATALLAKRAALMVHTKWRGTEVALRGACACGVLGWAILEKHGRRYMPAPPKRWGGRAQQLRLALLPVLLLLLSWLLHELRRSRWPLTPLLRAPLCWMLKKEFDGIRAKLSELEERLEHCREHMSTLSPPSVVPSPVPPPPPPTSKAAIPTQKSAANPRADVEPRGGNPLLESVKSFHRKKEDTTLAKHHDELMALFRDIINRTFEMDGPRSVGDPRITVRLQVAPSPSTDDDTATTSTGGEMVAAGCASKNIIKVKASVGYDSWWGNVRNQLEEQWKLPIEGKQWGLRLAQVKRKKENGGGCHYTDAERMVADEAHERIRVIGDYVEITSRLAKKAEKLPRLGETLAAQPHLKPAQRLEHYAKEQAETFKLLRMPLPPDPQFKLFHPPFPPNTDRYKDDSYYKKLGQRFVAARLPDTLPASLATARSALTALLRQVLKLAENEYASWDRMKDPNRAMKASSTYDLLSDAQRLAEMIKEQPKTHVGAELKQSDVCDIDTLVERKSEARKAADKYRADKENDGAV